jgi:membrane protease YdiL (CAAX protease family)
MSDNDPLPEHSGDNNIPHDLPDIRRGPPTEYGEHPEPVYDAVVVAPLPLQPRVLHRPSGIEEMLPPPERPQPLGATFVWGIAYFFVALALCVIFLVLSQVIPAVFVAVILLVGKGISGQLGASTQQALTKEILMPTLLTSEIVGVIVSLVALRLVVGRDWPRKIALRPPGWFHLLLTVLAVPAQVVVANGVYAVAKRWLPSFSDLGISGMEELVKDVGSWPLWLGILVVGVGPALNEELFCRAFLGRGLVGRNGVLARICITAFFFGLIHVDPPQATMAAVLGLVLYYIYVTTRSLLMPMLTHFLINSLSVVGSYFEHGLENIDQNPEAFTPLLLAGACVLLATILIALYLTRARLAGENGAPPTWEPLVTGVEHPPRGSGTKVVRPSLTSRQGAVAILLVAGGLVVFAATLIPFLREILHG